MLSQAQINYQMLSRIQCNAKARIFEAVEADNEDALATAEYNYSLAELAMQTCTLVSILDSMDKAIHAQNKILAVQNERMDTQNRLMQTQNEILNYIRKKLSLPRGIAAWFHL